eukprot:356357-Chlamydomonas_euryale.AAC.2
MPASAPAGPRPQTCMHVHAPRPPASGNLRACISLASGRPRPRQASTNVLCTDHPASVSN